ncbi:DUF3883 domain-containing protein [Flavobacterium sp. B11]|uniref:DUF3883 domain-containing protein n=1 Tax=Flavobacterium movens TaxID=214860 RepID=UPI0031DC71EF
MKKITANDLKLINDLYSRSYTRNTILSNANESERVQLLLIRRKLKSIAEYFSAKYVSNYGPFETEMSSGNPVGQSTNLNNVWAGFFKGNSNKQYSAQISFVVNRFEKCLDVGFYFGRASSRSITNEEKRILESQFKEIGANLSASIEKNVYIKERFNSLFEYGFKAYLNGNPSTPNQWKEGIAINPQSSHIIAKIYPDEFGEIENAKLDLLVAQVVFLMGSIDKVTEADKVIPPLTSEQYIKRAERLAEIGLKGELFIMEQETEKLERLGFLNNGYPRHVALESNRFGYDILSKNELGEDMYIEVKSTTRTIDDIYSRKFYLSNHEHNTYVNNNKNYKLARVYNIENLASVEYLNLEEVIKKTDGYIIEY